MADEQLEMVNGKLQVISNLGDVPKFDASSGQTFIYPNNTEVRQYQRDIIAKSITSNVLVVLPTGLGKTFIAAVLILNFYRYFPDGILIFMAPTRPLVKQQYEECHNKAGIKQSDMVSLTGESASRKSRASIWKEKHVFFCTPQLVQSDIDQHVIPLKKITMLVFDEAHKAQGNHAYVTVFKSVSIHNPNFRVLALSASPGSDANAIQNVLTNLCISQMIVKHDNDADVAPYIHKRIEELVAVDADIHTIHIRSVWMSMCQSYYSEFKASGLENCSIPLDRLSFAALQHCLTTILGNPAHQKHVNTIKILSKFARAKELLDVYGLRCFYSTLKTFNSDQVMKQVLDKSSLYREFCLEIDRLVKANPRSTKGEKLVQLVSEFVQKNPKARVIVFTSLRESVVDLVDVLSVPNLKPAGFMGQSNSTDIQGQNQKEQQLVLDKFRSGVYNVLVCTCIGEEGLDIKEVDLAVMYDTQSSSKRTIQRLGRTGRHSDGHVVYLVTKNSVDERRYNKSIASREASKKDVGTQQILGYLYHLPDGCEPKVVYEAIVASPMTAKKGKTAKTKGTKVPADKSYGWDLSKVHMDQSIATKYQHMRLTRLYGPSISSEVLMHLTSSATRLGGPMKDDSFLTSNKGKSVQDSVGRVDQQLPCDVIVNTGKSPNALQAAIATRQCGLCADLRSLLLNPHMYELYICADNARCRCRASCCIPLPVASPLTPVPTSGFVPSCIPLPQLAAEAAAPPHVDHACVPSVPVVAPRVDAAADVKPCQMYVPDSPKHISQPAVQRSPPRAAPASVIPCKTKTKPTNKAKVPENEIISLLSSPEDETPKRVKRINAHKFLASQVEVSGEDELDDEEENSEEDVNSSFINDGDIEESPWKASKSKKITPDRAMYLHSLISPDTPDPAANQQDETRARPIPRRIILNGREVVPNAVKAPTPSSPEVVDDDDGIDLVSEEEEEEDEVEDSDDDDFIEQDKRRPKIKILADDEDD